MMNIKHNLLLKVIIFYALLNCLSAIQKLSVHESEFDYDDVNGWPDIELPIGHTNYCGGEWTYHQSPKGLPMYSDTNKLHTHTCDYGSADMLYSIWDLKEHNLDETYNIEKSTHGLKLVSKNIDSALDSKIKLKVNGTLYCHDRNVYFHWGSEHYLNGERYPLEAHYIHYQCDLFSIGQALNHWKTHHLWGEDPNYKVLAVVSVLFAAASEDNPAFTKVLDSLDANEVAQNLNPEPVEINYLTDGLVPNDDMEFYEYQGSTTTPPCWPTVNWIVAKEVSTTISHTQLAALKEITDKNYRRTTINNLDLYKDTCLPYGSSQGGGSGGGDSGNPTDNVTDTSNGGNSGKSYTNAFCFCADPNQMNNVEGNLNIPSGAIVEIKEGGDCELECATDNSGGRRLLNDSDSDELNHYTVTITVEITPENAASYTEEHSIDHFTSMSQEELESYGKDIIDDITNTLVEQIESNCDGCDISPIGEPVIEESGGETPTEPENPTGNETDSSDGGSDSSETVGDSSTVVVIKISRIFCNGDNAPTIIDIDITIQEAGLEEIVIGVTLDGPKPVTPVPDECKTPNRRLLQSAALDSNGASEWTIIVKADDTADLDSIEQKLQESSFCKNSADGECKVEFIENEEPPSDSPCIDATSTVESYRRMYKTMLESGRQEENYGVLTKTHFLTFMFSAGAQVTGCSECMDSLYDWSTEANSLFGESNTVSLPQYLKKNVPSKDYNCAEKYFPESLYIL